MKRFGKRGMMAGLLACVLGGQAARAQDLYASAEILGWHRDQPAGFFIGGDAFTGATLMSDRNAFDFDLGQRVRLGQVLGEDASTELVYTGINEWSTSGELTGDTIFSSPVLANFSINRLGYRYDSTLHGLEWNGQRGLLEGGDWTGSVLFGARYVFLGEEFDVFGDPGSGDETVARTTNHLFGPQLGAEFVRGTADSVRFRLGGKGAALLNIASESTANALNPLFAGEETSVQFGTIVELHAGIEKSFGGGGTIKAGYQIFALNGVALAPDQLANLAAPVSLFGNATTEVHDQGAIFAHGLSLGFEKSW